MDRTATRFPGNDRLCLPSFALAAGLLLVAPVQALAQAAQMSPPPAMRPARAADPQFLVAEKAFLALDLAARKAIQHDLIWGGGFVGSATGDFGPLTFAAIKRFEAAARLPANGILTGPARERLHRLAEERRRASGFAIKTDPHSKMRIGLPGFLQEKSAPNSSGGMRWQDKDERITLDLSVFKPGDTLAALFEKGSNPRVKGRKITYRLLRDDFFVITGETAGGKFYRRLEKNARNEIHGFSIGYDKRAAGMVDPFIVAMAATFEAFPKALQGTAAGSTKTLPGNISSSSPVPSQRRASGLVLAGAGLLTAEVALKGCGDIAVDAGKGAGKGAASAPVKVVRVLAGTGLMLLSGQAGKPAALPVAVAADGPATLIQRGADGELLASAAELAAGRVSTSLQSGGAGGLLFNASGALIGVIAASPVEKFRVAGVVPALSYAFVPAAEVVRLAGATAATGADAAPKSAATIAESVRGAVVSLVCRSDR